MVARKNMSQTKDGNILVFSLFLLSTLLGSVNAHAAQAVTMAEAKSAIQAAYDKEYLAAARRDLPGTSAHYAPNFVSLLINAPVQNREQVRAGIASMFSRQQSFQAKTVIRRISLRRNVATVIVVEHAKAIVLDPVTFQPNTLVQDDTSQDIWVQTGRNWQETRSRELTVKSTLNGAELPGR